MARSALRLALVLALLLITISARADPPPTPEDPTAPAPPPATAPAAQEDPPHRLVWNERAWRRFDWIEYSATVAVLGLMAYVEFGIPPATDSNWEGGIFFDKPVRRFVVGGSRDTRETAGAVSDWFTLAPQVLIFVDTIGVPLFTDDWNLDVAWQTTVMNVQALAVVGVFSRLGHRLVRRSRPDTQPCKDDRGYGELCYKGTFAGFPSGHTSAAFAAAGLTCAHHQYLPLYGGGWPDMTACIAVTTIATASGLLRMTANRHYVSDILVGAALGFGVGYGFPVLFHYEWGDDDPAPAEQTSLRWTVTPFTTDTTAGAMMVGIF